MDNKVQFKEVYIDKIEDLAMMRVKFLLDYYPNVEVPEIEKLHNDTKQYLKQQFEKKNLIGILGYVNDEIVCTGFLLFFEVPPLMGETGRIMAYVLNVYTLVEHRKNGYASEMMVFIKTISKEKGIKCLLLNASKMGEGVYRNLGFFESENKALILDL